MSFLSKIDIDNVIRAPFSAASSGDVITAVAAVAGKKICVLWFNLYGSGTLAVEVRSDTTVLDYLPANATNETRRPLNTYFHWQTAAGEGLKFGVVGTLKGSIGYVLL